MFINKEIAFFEIGQEIEGYYLIRDLSFRTTTTNRPFLTVFLSDNSGTVEAKAWDYAGDLSRADIGKVLKIRGDVSEYKGTLQITLSRLRLAAETDEFDVSRLVPTAPLKPEDEFLALRNRVESIEDDDYRKIALCLLDRHKERFCEIPAAKSVHHGFLNGLLMHTGNMLRIADEVSRIYADTVDRSLLLAGTVLHDFAKEKEFQFSPLGMVQDYSVNGQLLGHLVMGAEEVAETAKELGIPEEKSVLLRHLILSHHGEPEHGAAVRPVCAEAELLSYIDMIDSRMEIYREAFEKLPVGEFSDRIFALDKKIYHHTDLSHK